MHESDRRFGQDTADGIQRFGVHLSGQSALPPLPTIKLQTVWPSVRPMPPRAGVATQGLIIVLMALCVGCQSEQDETMILDSLNANVQRNSRGQVSSVKIPRLPSNQLELLESTLPQLHSLDHLSLHGPTISNRCLNAIPNLPSLHSLDISGTNINDAAILQIRDVMALETLNLSFCELISDRTLELMRGMPNLRELNLDSCHQISDEGMAHLCSLKMLRTLSLEDTAISGAGISQLHGCPVQRLYIGGTTIDDAGLSYLAELPNLRELFIGDTAIGDEGLQQLSRLPNLRYLVVENTRVTEQGVEKLRSAIDHDVDIKWGGIYMELSTTVTDAENSQTAQWVQFPAAPVQEGLGELYRL